MGDGTLQFTRSISSRDWGAGGNVEKKQKKKVAYHVNYFGCWSSAIGSPDQFSTMAISNFNKSSGGS